MSHRRPLLLALAFAAALVLAACGSSDGGNGAGNGTDAAFVGAMVPHHEMAIDMAKLAQEKSKRAEIKQLAADIIKAQKAEIAQLKAIGHDLQTIKKTPLGIPSHMAGMDGDMTALEHASPFDRGFVDQMIPHHQGAIRMAYAELNKGRSPALQDIAKGIIDAQSREIVQMNEWRKEWYGRPSPAGGIPTGKEPGHAGHSS